MRPCKYPYNQALVMHKDRGLQISLNDQQIIGIMLRVTIAYYFARIAHSKNIHAIIFIKGFQIPAVQIIKYILQNAFAVIDLIHGILKPNSKLANILIESGSLFIIGYIIAYQYHS